MIIIVIVIFIIKKKALHEKKIANLILALCKVKVILLLAYTKRELKYDFYFLNLIIYCILKKSVVI